MMFRIKSIVLIVNILFVFNGLAQPGGGPPGPPGGGGPPCWAPPCVPIDNGISLLVAGGLALGIFTIARKKGPEK